MVLADASPRVVVALVAYNRAGLLARCLDALAGQTRPPDEVVVIDNASTDNSAEVAAQHPVVDDLVRMPVNTGGAGGFAAGIARAVARGADLVWTMDDDTVPSPTALDELLWARQSYQGTPAVLASRADWHDGREHPMNTPRRRLGIRPELHESAARVGAKQIRSASFVSILVDARAVREDGLPEADYFLWNDDFEYTARLLRRRVGLYVPASRVTHLTKTFGSSDADPGARFFNEVRNKVWLYTRSSALDGRDRILYSGATVKRWVGLLGRAEDRGALLGHAGRGLKAALSPPRSTVEVLAGTPVEADVRAIEDARRG